jgi:hypothetical protein
LESPLGILLDELFVVQVLEGQDDLLGGEPGLATQVID